MNAVANTDQVQPSIWCSAAKDLIVTSLSSSRIWATVENGNITEIFWPSTGRAEVRDLSFVISDGENLVDVRASDNYELSSPKPFIPLPTLVHHVRNFELELSVVCDPVREVVLVHYRLHGDHAQLYCFLTPRLAVINGSNTVKITDSSFSITGDDRHLHFRCDQGFKRGGAGHFSRTSCDRYSRQMDAVDWNATEIEGNDLAAVAELNAPEGVLALGFAFREKGSETLARSSLAEGFPSVMSRAQAGWEAWRTKLRAPEGLTRRWFSEVEVSAAVLKACEERLYPGALVASLCAPWGGTVNDLAGYHLVWPRDSAKMGFAMIALENYDDARQMATYLLATQQADGSWSQNFYPDGESYWHGNQLDETGFPLLLVAKLWELGQLGELRGIDEMVWKACKYLASAGPVTLEDRWEESKGISVFTLAVIIASIVGAAPLLTDEADRKYLLSYADYLNRRIEDWLYVEHTALARKYDVDGYYLRLATTAIFNGAHGRMPIANSDADIDVVDMVAVDYMYLPRLGLRRGDDPRLRSTLKVVEGEVCVVTPAGPGFYRYPHDSYGEHQDGSPFDGSGRGRLWPLLTGERGHLAIALGQDPSPYLDAMCQMSNRAGLIPEQIWDADPIPERRLFPGKPTGSATPLLWAHAEFLSLASALATGKSIEQLDAVQQRYGGERPEPRTWHWRPDAPFSEIPRGVELLVEAASPFTVQYAIQPPGRSDRIASQALGLGRHGAVLNTGELETGCEIRLTIDSPGAFKTEGSITIGH